MLEQTDVLTDVRREERLQQQAVDEVPRSVEYLSDLFIKPEQSVLKNMKPESEISPDNEMLDLLSKETPRAPTAREEGTEETLNNLDKIPALTGSEGSLHAVLNICSENFQMQQQQEEEEKKGKNPSVTSVQIASSADPKEGRILCRESEPRTEGAAVSTDQTVTESETQVDQRLSGLESKEDSNGQSPEAGHKQVHNQPSDDALCSVKDAGCDRMFSFDMKRVRTKGLVPLVELHKNGKPFTVRFPDGTGQVCYPSGRLAILVTAAQTADWLCVVVLEDKEDEPRIQAILTNRGHGTCYHGNGSIWVNLTPRGGICCSETGDLKKHWSWSDNRHHVHAPPCQPLNLIINPNVKIQIKSQEDIRITFTSERGSVQLNNRASLKLNKSTGLMMPAADLLQRYLSQKSREINALLQNIQSLITYQKATGPSKVKLQQKPHLTDGKTAAASEKAAPLPRRPPKADHVLQ